MCLNPVAKPAKLVQNLVVYKIIKMDDCSPVRNFQYAPFTTYRTHRKLAPDNYGYYHRGFHAYTSCIIARREISLAFGANHKVVMFVIPKGTTVVFGIRNDVCTPTIRSGSLESLNQTRVFTH